MAKGNLILGTAKNSVGDVVMYRREGAQITRVRVRNVKNPKTNAQSFQRAIMAPIAKFYSPLSVVLERSFEGLSKAKSHNKFNQVNANLARKNKWALPKGTGFFPLPYQLSQGTIPTIDYSILSDEGSAPIGITHSGAAPTNVGQVSADFVAAGYKNGDVVTMIVAFFDNKTGAGFPGSFQFIIDTESKESIDTLKNGVVGLGFDEDNGYHFVTTGGFRAGVAVIVSRFDGNMWRRSTQSLYVDTKWLQTYTTDAAVAAAIASYGMSAGDGNPLVYLDGDELADGE